ncbi:glycosyltransferase family 39 protein, partial [Amycolatopsis sp. SID8362]|uniref:ArnT family glycosyltransferase n=1 Tax=Amycolatopsis sp. SID8362 TaxID=2690346 RepID=UPI00137047F3
MITAAPPKTRSWALPLICLGAAVLYAWKIGDGQLGNTYYSAAAKSMTSGFTNFLFGSFDPYGVVTVDKPPFALWPQALSVLVFGYHGWALLLPQVLEGVAAVFLLHRTVRRWAGENVALLAAAILALTPVTVIINRDNNPDTLLVLFLVAAAYAVTRALEDGRKWLFWCAFFVGCGFLTKMLQAWIVVPALVAAYLAGTSGPLKRRLLDVLGAGAVLIASSFWWIALYDWWPGAKPYMGGSADGSAWDLVFGYNGFGRLSGNGEGGGMMIMRDGEQTTSSFGGDPGPGRMFNDLVGGQISWLLPLCLVVLIVIGRRWRDAGWLLWGGWLLVTTAVFSFAGGIWHPYYTTAMAPAVAAVAAAGLALLWRRHRRTLLPLVVALTAAWAFVVTSRDTTFHGWTRWAVLGTAVAAI